MIITCENCSTSFNLDEKLLKPSGSKVRCSKCKNLFIAYPPAPPEEEVEVIEEAVVEETPAATTGEAGTAVGSDLQEVEEAEGMAPETEEAGEPESSLAAVTESVEEDVAVDRFEDLEMDFDLDMEPEPESSEAPVAETDEESSDLTIPDFDETVELRPDAEDKPAAEAPSEELDLDFDLDMEPEPESAEAPIEETDEESTGFDISDFDETMELRPDAEDKPGVEASSEELDLDFDLDMEPAPDIEQAAEKAEDIEAEELDFSDFEETVMLDSPPAQDVGTPSEDRTEDLDLDLDLDLGMEEEPASGEGPDMPSIKDADEVDLEDLDLEMDLEMESGDGQIEAEPEDEATEDIDLSDIEKMLEPEADAAVDAEVEKWKQQPAQENLMDETAEIDLSDIVLDAEEVQEADAEDVELDLDIDEAEEKKAIEAAAEPVKEASDIDISEFEEFEIPEEETHAEQNFGGGDIELEFELEGETTPVGVKPLDTNGIEPETVAFAAPFIDSEENQEETSEKKQSGKKIKPARKSSIVTPILIVLIVLVLAFAAVIALDRFNMSIPVVSDYVKQIPYVGQLMKTEAVQVGEIRIANITSKFVDNAAHGKFFVIKGTATNEYPEPRRYIKITGTLFRSGKVVSNEEDVFCGNMISDANLAEMDLAAIKERLSNRFGDNRSNFEVKPGQEIPFMIVFSGLPDDLEEFAIEVAGSSPVQQQ